MLPQGYLKTLSCTITKSCIEVQRNIRVMYDMHLQEKDITLRQYGIERSCKLHALYISWDREKLNKITRNFLHHYVSHFFSSDNSKSKQGFVYLSNLSLKK